MSTSFKLDADLRIGHLHLVQSLRLSYKKHVSLENLKRDFIRFLKKTTIDLVLKAHARGDIQSFIEEAVLPTFRQALASQENNDVAPVSEKALKSLFNRAARMLLHPVKPAFFVAEQFLVSSYEMCQSARVRKYLHRIAVEIMPALEKEGGLNQFVSNLMLFAVERVLVPAFMFFGRNKIGEVLPKVADQMLPVLEKDPGISLLKGIALADLQPKVPEKVAAQTSGGYDACHFEVSGCPLDGRTTYHVTFEDGFACTLDWMKVRPVLGLTGDILTGDPFVVDHFNRYPGLHPDTLKEAVLYMKYRGVLSEENILAHSFVPDLDQMSIVNISEAGTVDWATPDGRPMTRSEMPSEADEIIPRGKILKALEYSLPQTAADLRQRMGASEDLRNLFDPDDGFDEERVACPVKPGPRYNRAARSLEYEGVVM